MADQPVRIEYGRVEVSDQDDRCRLFLNVFHAANSWPLMAARLLPLAICGRAERSGQAHLEPGRSLIDLEALLVDLGAELTARVEVVAEAGLRPARRERVLRHSISL